MKEIIICGDFITLAQFLKMESYINSGGEAKYFLAENSILLNGELENRRGKKLYHNDIVKLDNKEYKIINEN